MSQPQLTARRGYDWLACLAALIAAFVVAAPVGLLVARVTSSGALMIASITIVATAVSGVVYPRVARRGAKGIDEESCCP